MTGHVVSFEPKRNQDQTPYFFSTANGTFYSYVVTANINGTTYQGEANSKSQQPWWELNKSYEIEVSPNDKSIGGHSFKINKPKIVTGGSNYIPPAQPTSQTPPPNFQPTNELPFDQSQPKQPEPLANVPAPTPQYVSKDLKEPLIVAQSSMRTAVEYVSSLDNEKKDALIQWMKEKVDNETSPNDVICTYAKYIFNKTYELAETKR